MSNHQIYCQAHQFQPENSQKILPETGEDLQLSSLSAQSHIAQNNSNLSDDEYVHEQLPFDTDEHVTIDPADLLDKYQAIQVSKKKATNAPKHFIKLLSKEIQNYRPYDQNYEKNKLELSKFMESINHKPKNRYHLQYLFGDSQNQTTKNRNALHRKVLLKKLIRDRFEEILDNNMIPKGNKLHYLFFSKIYEWRLSDVELIGRFQS